MLRTPTSGTANQNEGHPLIHGSPAKMQRHPLPGARTQDGCIETPHPSAFGHTLAELSEVYRSFQ